MTDNNPVRMRQFIADVLAAADRDGNSDADGSRACDRDPIGVLGSTTCALLPMDGHEVAFCPVARKTVLLPSSSTASRTSALAGILCRYGALRPRSCMIGIFWHQ